jgi:hypothetical protein
MGARGLAVTAVAFAAAGLLGLPGRATVAEATTIAGPPPAVAGAQAATSLNIQYQVRETGYWCGPPPPASRCPPGALTCRAGAPSPRGWAPRRTAPITSARSSTR